MQLVGQPSIGQVFEGRQVDQGRDDVVVQIDGSNLLRVYLQLGLDVLAPDAVLLLQMIDSLFKLSDFCLWRHVVLPEPLGGSQDSGIFVWKTTNCILDRFDGSHQRGMLVVMTTNCIFESFIVSLGRVLV